MWIFKKLKTKNKKNKNYMDQNIVFHEYEQQKRKKKGCILFPVRFVLSCLNFVKLIKLNYILQNFKEFFWHWKNNILCML